MYLGKINLLILILCAISYETFTINRTFKDKNTIVLVILTQPTPHHQYLAQNLIDNVKTQIQEHGIKIPIIFHQIDEFNENGAWTFLPLFDGLNKIYGNHFEWIVFCQERTRFDLPKFLGLLDKHESFEYPVWIGHALFDLEATIIHHFQFYQDPTVFKYPNLASGFVMNRVLFYIILNRISTAVPKEDFSIDASYELALFIWKINNSLTLKHDELFCATENNTEHCATHPLKYRACNTNPQSVTFAVKTCKHFHGERIPVIKQTWGQYYDNILYFSNEHDVSIPTIKLNVTNVGQGHCTKTKLILEYLSKNLANSTEWIAIVDDDTIIRLQQFLSCFDASKPQAIGERYGYGLTAKAYKGYNYITGGGGMILSRPLLSMLTKRNTCMCPSSETPDDMFIFGLCLAYLNVPIIHSSLFHQARPSDYAPAYLSSDPPISFHKHWMTDPVQIYTEWFEMNDQQWYMSNIGAKIHDDL